MKKILFATVCCVLLSLSPVLICHAEEVEVEVEEEIDPEEDIVVEDEPSAEEVEGGVDSRTEETTAAGSTDKAPAWFERIFPDNWLENGIKNTFNGMVDKLVNSVTLDFNYMEDGGFLTLVDDDTNSLIGKIYRITYPIGVVIMVFCWIFGLAKTGLHSSVDPRQKDSIITSALSIVIGAVGLSLAPFVLSALVGVSLDLLGQVYRTTGAGDLSSVQATGTVTLIVRLIIGLVLGLNVLWVATLQAVSPIFIGFIGGETTRKFAMNFIKEYIKALIVPVITVVYYNLSLSIVGNYSSAISLIQILVGLVFGISVLGVAGKKLDKLIG